MFEVFFRIQWGSAESQCSITQQKLWNVECNIRKDFENETTDDVMLHMQKKIFMQVSVSV